MPCGTPYTEEERRARHYELYGTMEGFTETRAGLEEFNVNFGMGIVVGIITGVILSVALMRK